MNYMEKSKRPKRIQIPVWMNQAIFELAYKHNRSISGEIAYLVETATMEIAQGICDREKIG